MTSESTGRGTRHAGTWASASGVLLALLACSYLLSYVDRMLMIVLAETIKKEFLLSDKQLSLLTGAAFVLMYGTAGIFAGRLVDSVNRKRLLAGAIVLWSAMTAACGLSASFVQLAIARAGVGIGEAVTLPTGFSLISDSYAPKRRAMATALFFCGGMVGVLVAFSIGSWVAVHYGWRTAFFCAGPPGLALAVLIALFAREPERERAATAPGPGPGSVEEVVSQFSLVRRNQPLVWLLLAIAVAAFANVGMMQWIPAFFRRSHHLSTAQIGLFFGPVLSGGMIAGNLAGGWLGNRAADRSVSDMLRLCQWILIAAIPLYLLVLSIASLPLTLLLMFFTTALTVIYAPIASAAWQTVCDPRARGTAAGLSGFAANLIGGALCPFLVGFMSDAWAPQAGADSLRYALMAGMTIFCIAAGLFAYSARLVRAGEAAAPMSAPIVTRV